RFERVVAIRPDEVMRDGWTIERPDYGPWSGTIPAHPPTDDAMWPWPFRHGYLLANTVGASFTCTFRGPLLGFHADYTDLGGTLQLSVDGQVLDTISLNIDGCLRLPLAFRHWLLENDADEHTLQVTLIDMPSPESAPPRYGRARIGYLFCTK
ncbi:MAG TPA: hypothetical protein VGM23_16025, partial [Armatimonadota bacterium]